MLPRGLKKALIPSAVVAAIGLSGCHGQRLALPGGLRAGTPGPAIASRSPDYQWQTPAPQVSPQHSGSTTVQLPAPVPDDQLNPPDFGHTPMPADLGIASGPVDAGAARWKRLFPQSAQATQFFAPIGRGFQNLARHVRNVPQAVRRHFGGSPRLTPEDLAPPGRVRITSLPDPEQARYPLPRTAPELPEGDFSTDVSPDAVPPPPAPPADDFDLVLPEEPENPRSAAVPMPEFREAPQPQASHDPRWADSADEKPQFRSQEQTPTFSAPPVDDYFPDDQPRSLPESAPLVPVPDFPESNPSDSGGPQI